jgi:hypothetical protein
MGLSTHLKNIETNLDILKHKGAAVAEAELVAEEAEPAGGMQRGEPIEEEPAEQF